MPDTTATRLVLQTRLDELLAREARLAARWKTPAEPLPADSEEQAAALQDEEVLRDLDQTEVAEIARLRAALARIDAGTFGVCVACGGPIEGRRLAALPTADRCLGCAN